MRASNARAGRRTGQACPRCWSAYGKPQGRGRKERFTALFHHLSPEMLRTAFFALRREAAPAWMG